VTTLIPADLPTLQAALAVPATKLYTPAAGLAPEYETIELLSGQFPSLSLEQLLKKLDAEAKLDGRYFLCNQEQLLDTARVLGKVSGVAAAAAEAVVRWRHCQLCWRHSLLWAHQQYVVLASLHPHMCSSKPPPPCTAP